MARLRIKEAIAKHNESKAEKLTISDIARFVYRDRNIADLHKRIRFYSLVNNKCKYVELETIKDICTITGVSPEFLIDFEN